MTGSRKQADDEPPADAEKQGEALLGLVLDSLAEAVLVADAESRILLVNQRAREMLGIDLGATPAERWISALSLRHADGTPFEVSELPIARAVRGERVDDLEMLVRSAADARELQLSATARPLVGLDGRLWGGVAVLRDVSVQRRHEAQLIISDRMASVGSLAAGVTHEINNPLAAVLANVELALGDARSLPASRTTERLIEELSDAQEASNRVREIVRDLKLFSRTEEERHGPVDVREVLESALRMAWNEIRHRARLVRSFEDVPLVHGNDARLGQVFLNLLVNAAHAIPDGRAESNEIRVALRRVGEHVLVEISDTGSGMSEDVLRQVFTPFFTTKPLGVGSGVGLPVCQRIISALGGQIAVESKLGIGSTFRVLVPTAEVVTTTPPRSYGPSSSAPPPRRGRVLVVDDEPMVALAVQRTLEAQHDVSVVNRAQDALEMLKAGKRFDVIFCDVMMPNVTGIDFFREVSAFAPSEIDKIVFLTGGAFASQARQFLEAVPNLRLDKPFTPDELRKLVRSRVH
jgi:signal transduction histidine kinase